MQTFARLIDGKLVEYPVYPVHIETRGEPLDWYTLVKYETKPEVDEFHFAREILTVFGDEVRVTYAVEPLSLEALFGRFPLPEGDPRREMFPHLADQEEPSQALKDRIVELVTKRVQERLDKFAATRTYGDEVTAPIVSACSYAASTNPARAAEGQYCLTARDATWDALFAFRDEVLAGTRPFPTSYQEIEAALPELVWPV